MNVQEILEKIKKEEVIDEPTVKKICRKVQEVLMGQSNVELVQSPITLVGDIHGQFYDVLKIFTIGMLSLRKLVTCLTTSIFSSEILLIEVTTQLRQ